MTERGSIEYQKTVEVGDDEYTIHVLPPTEALKLLGRIVKIIGEPFSELMRGAGEELDGDVERKAAAEKAAAEAIPLAARALCRRLDEDEVVAIIKKLMQSVNYDNSPVSRNFERHFQGRLGHLMKVTYATLEVQYEDFLGAVSEMMNGDLIPMKLA